MDRPETENRESDYAGDRANDPATYARPGDPMMDPKTEPGYILIGLALISFVLAIIAAAYDLNGWLPIAVAACVLFFAAGAAWVVFQRGRKKQSMSNTKRGVPPGLRRKWRSSRGA